MKSVIAPVYAYTPEPPPAAGVLKVLDAALNLIGQEFPFTQYLWMQDALIKRAEMGKEKYGDYLRTRNSRNPLVDFLQEQLDAVMYATQAYMEKPSQKRYNLVNSAIGSALCAYILIEEPDLDW